MSIIDFIVNIAALLLWLNFRALGFDPLVRTSAASLAGTLRRADPRRLRRWHFLAALTGVLLFRGWFYHQIGPAVDWMPTLSLGSIGITFRSDFQSRMLLFSLFSFLGTLGFFYLSALFVSILNGSRADGDQIQRLVRLHLGVVDGWPVTLRWGLPLVLAVGLWLACSPALTALKLVPPAVNFMHRFEQGILLGLGAYISWKYLAGLILGLYLVTSYIYLGSHPFWTFIATSGSNLLKPLRRLPLTLGKADFAPIIAILVIFLAAETLAVLLARWYPRLPF